MEPVRVRSLDVFRGATMAAMVIVNNPGDWSAVYGPLLHAEWHGWTPTDLIFPFFLYIVGAAIPLGSVEGRSPGPALRRAATIFGLGLLLAGFPFFRIEAWRIPGVLQRIALCYLAAAALVSVAGPDARSIRRMAGGATVALLVGYACLMIVVPVPGGAAGDLSPSGNWAAWLDRALLGGHLWRADWDPEGILSTLPAVATTLLGVQAGLLLRSSPSHRHVVRTLAHWGLAGVVAGLAWHPVFPINKGLWTSSYVLFTAGAASAALAACYWWADVEPSPVRRACSEPFVALGRNALLLFVVSGLVAKTLVTTKWPDPAMSLGGWIHVAAFAPLAPPKVASLLYAAANLALLFALLWALHRRRLYWTA